MGFTGEPLGKWACRWELAPWTDNARQYINSVHTVYERYKFTHGNHSDRQEGGKRTLEIDNGGSEAGLTYWMHKLWGREPKEDGI